MKKLFILTLSIIMSLIFTSELKALEGYTTGTDIMVRYEANVNSGFIDQIRSINTKLDLVDNTIYNKDDPNCNAGWYKLNYNGQTGYICSLFVAIGTPDTSDLEYEARIYGYNIKVKDTPNGYTKATLLPGANVTIEGDKISGSGCADGWYKIRYYKNDLGYVCSTYVRKKSELTASNATYEQELKNAGFPDTYIPYLVKLHELHPNWKFNAKQTNIEWNYLVTQETSKNYIEDDFVNDIVKEVYTKGWSNESGWYVATDGINAFYLDPRNFLTEKFVFMFEALGYNYGSDDRNTFNRDSASTKKYYDSISKMLEISDYLNTDEYKYMFLGAGFKYKVSPIHLVGRVIQEGGSQSSYVAITGTSGEYYNGKPLYGYYNYYNIGASGANAVYVGLAYACGSTCGYKDTYGRPWTSREKAIYGGAEFISGSYISQGQDTLYYQKFDLNGFWHQYQTNVLAPASEGIDAFNAYKSAGLIDSPIEFDIPVYLNMPNIVNLPNIASTVNTLKEIKVDGKVISGYDEDVTDYIVYVNATSSNVNIEATKNSSVSKVTGLGTVNLTDTTTIHKITVTAESGDTKTYNLTLKKVTDTTTVNDIISNLSVKVTGDIMNNISPDTHASTLEQSILKYSPNAQVTITSINGNKVTGAALLGTGQTIKITSPSGDTKTFRIAVIGDTNGDGTADILDLLRIQKHILKSTILSDINQKGADTNGDGRVDILDLLRVQKHILKDIKL